MEDVLHAVDHGGTVGALGDVDDALQAQEIGTAMLGQDFQEERQRDGSDRRRTQDCEAGNPDVMAAVVARDGVIASLRLDTKPGLQVDTLCRRAGEPHVEQPLRIDLAEGRLAARRPRH